MKYYVLVTGASSGIGERACRVLLSKGYQIIAGVRNESDALRLSESMGQNVFPLLMDVTNPTEMEAARERAQEIIGEGALVAIINNAGIVVSGATLYIPLEEWRRQLDVNVLGVIRTTQLFFPLLAKPKQAGDTHPRRIINVSSISGLFASPFVGPYATSKFALEAMSDSLRRELLMYDIQVVLLEPGNIATAIWEKAKSAPVYFGPEYDAILEFKDRIIDENIRTGLPVEVLDKYLLKAVSGRKIKLRYLIRREKWKFRLILMLPAQWVDSMVRKKLQQRSGIRPF